MTDIAVLAPRLPAKVNPMNVQPKRVLALVACLTAATLLLAACGGGDESGSTPTVAPADTTAATTAEAPETTAPGSSGSSTITACELFPQDEAEAIIGAPLELIAASDDYRCSYDGGLVDGELLGALLSISPTSADASDLAAARGALDPATTEDIEGLGEAAYYWDAGAVHSVNFVKNGVFVIVTVNELVDGDDVRAAEMQIALAASARL